MTRTEIRIGSAPNLAYAPQYVAVSRGYFRDAGVDVRIIGAPPGSSDIVTQLVRGEINVVLGSLLFAHRMDVVTRGNARIVSGANANSRHVLMARNGEFVDGIDWADLRGTVVNIAPTFVPTSWFAFREGLRRHGLTLEDVPTLVGFQSQHVIQEFLDGAGDLLFIGGEEGQHPDLHRVATMADGYGPVPWSVYCAAADWADSHTEELVAFRQGINRGMQWVFEADIDEIVAQLSPDFPALDDGKIADTIRSYREIPFWARTAEIDLAALEGWQDALIRWGMLAAGTDLLKLAGACPSGGPAKRLG
ncbi:ABC transporter substrate-binding protein [Microbacterium sp. ASV81]|uniref:ABC transporter substrate-binding protein n=1 Tax=Microbacterium capsulatum TaxID=3041921 RepID=A0ABU0XD94_9MICO|nr:ABC transporter substrate-binding protein [Microbacterium sp. ASV81]MDQ4213087.1 ABC transporter substrate-binding protein [Microbacterium sp. ASV81]